MENSTCKYLEHGIYFAPDAILHCERSLSGQDSLTRPFTSYSGEFIDEKKFFEVKQKIAQNFACGIIPEFCKNCSERLSGDYSAEKYISEYFISHRTTCDLKCKYCFNTLNRVVQKKEYKILPVLKDMLEKGILRFNGTLYISGGEFTGLKEFDEIIGFFLDNEIKNINIDTSAVKYSRTVEKILKRGNAKVTVSVDAGSRKVFEAVKGKDVYNDVVRNLKKYANNSEKSVLISKYVIMPGINDEREEIERWTEVSAECGIKETALDFDFHFLTEFTDIMPENLVQTVDYIKNTAKKHNIGLTLYGVLTRILNEYESNKRPFVTRINSNELYMSCEDLMHTVAFTPKGIRDCTDISAENAPVIYSVKPGEKVDINALMMKRHNVEKERRQGIFPEECKKCRKLKPKIYSPKDYINKILISHRFDCNADCLHCFNRINGKLVVQKQYYDVLPILNDMKYLIKKGAQMHFGGGEPVIWEEFDDIINFALNNDFSKIYIATNALKYSDILAKALNAGKASVVITADTGNPITFEKLKNVPMKQMTDTIKKYVPNAQDPYDLKTKFIIIPGINDSEEEISLWLDYSNQIGITSVVLDTEANFFRKMRFKIPEKIINLALYAEKIAKEKGMTFGYYGFAEQMMFDRSVR